MDSDYQLRQTFRMEGLPAGTTCHDASRVSAYREAESICERYVKSLCTSHIEDEPQVLMQVLDVTETFHTSRERMLELRDMFMAKCEPACPIIDVDQLDAHITIIIEDGFGSTAASCLVLLIFALASIWGSYPHDERRPVASNGTDAATDRTVAVPENRAKESWIYFSMAQRRMPMASMDDSLLGVTCFCLFGCASSLETT